MKETIYTIPVTEAYESDCECPFCLLEAKLEKEQVTYCVGASMMEPDHRIVSNEKGYCRRHYDLMSKEEGKALSLALVLDTHLQTVTETLNKMSPQHKKGGLFKKESEVSPLVSFLEKQTSSCLVCEKIEATLQKFAETFWLLYKKEPEFKEKVLSSKGFCLSHLALLLQTAEKQLSGKEKETAIAEIVALEKENLERLGKEVDWYTKKFDYRYQNEPWNNAEDAPQRAMEKLAKYV